MNVKTAVFIVGLSGLLLSGVEPAAPAVNVLKDGDFSQKQTSPQIFGSWWLGSLSKDYTVIHDTGDFKSAPQSLCIESNGKTIAIRQNLPALKPNTKYKIVFFMKTENVIPKGKYSGAILNICSDRNHWFPAKYQTGTQPWTRYEGVFTAGPNTNVKGRAYMLLYLMNASGKVWFDDILLTEVQ